MSHDTPPPPPGAAGQPDPSQPDAGGQPGAAQPGVGQPGAGQNPSNPGGPGVPPPPPGSASTGAAQHPATGSPGGDDRTLAVLAHLSPIIALVISAGFITFVGPLVIWLVFRERNPLVRNAAASAFNFAITVWLVTIVAWILVFTVVLIPLSILLFAAAGIAQIVFSIIGAVRASRGEIYRYPLQVPILN